MPSSSNILRLRRSSSTARQSSKPYCFNAPVSAPLELHGPQVVAARPHDEQVVAQAEVIEPGDRYVADPGRSGGEEDHGERGVEQVEQSRATSGISGSAPAASKKESQSRKMPDR